MLLKLSQVISNLLSGVLLISRHIRVLIGKIALKNTPISREELDPAIPRVLVRNSLKVIHTVMSTNHCLTEFLPLFRAEVSPKVTHELTIQGYSNRQCNNNES